MAHELNPETESPLLELGRLIHEESYPREKRGFSTAGMKVDLLYTRGTSTVVGEIKKSSRFMKSATMQLAYYLWRLKEMGVKAQGKLLIPKERKRASVVLTKQLESNLKEAVHDIQDIIARETPPFAIRIPFCRNCAYREFCWV